MNAYLPMSELPSFDDIEPADLQDFSLPALVWNVNVPASVDIERIQVNTRMLQRYHKVGAIVSSIVSEYQGETSTFTPGVSGVSSDGSAFATRAGVETKADKSEAYVLDPYWVPPQLQGHLGKSVIFHRLNKAEMATKISDGILQRGQSREEAWASELDASFRDSFRRGGKQHLMSRAYLVGRLWDYAFTGALSQGAIMELANGQSPLKPLAMLAMFQVVDKAKLAWMSKQLTGSAKISDIRWSVFIGHHQSDRYLALNAMSRMPGLVTARK